MKKEILEQYLDLRTELKDIRRRIEILNSKLKKLEPVTDSVSGTRSDGTIGSITVTGFPEPEYYRKKAAIKKYKLLMSAKEEELLECLSQVEEYIESVKDSEIRTILRMLYIDDLTYIQIACQMNMLHPKRRTKYTDENIKKKIQRFFRNVPQCPDEMW